MNIVYELIQIISSKEGDQEMAIFYDGDHEWSIHVGNPSGFVRLGEVDGELVSTGDSLEDAISQMIEMVRI